MQLLPLAHLHQADQMPDDRQPVTFTLRQLVRFFRRFGRSMTNPQPISNSGLSIEAGIITFPDTAFAVWRFRRASGIPRVFSRQ